MRFKRILNFFFFLFIVSCIEPYEFRVTDNEPTLVVEALISDKSFTETLAYPSDGRYFTVKLSKTGDVINIQPKMITGASVRLISDLGEEWAYTESFDAPGLYVLQEDDFKVLKDIQYKLRISLAEGDTYESAWEAMPSGEAPVIGEIGFRETETQQYVMEANKEVLRTIKGVTPHISIPPNNTGHPIHYRWEFTPQWIYIAPLSHMGSGNRTCWATDTYYINNYTLQEDNEGGYKKDLFFMSTVRNERLFTEFSLLVQQYTMTKNNYYFWKEMQDLNQGGLVFDGPPYNLKTNFHSLNGDKKVSGYFGVVGEQGTRWYFNIKDLSYSVENTLLPDCMIVYGPGWPYPNCTDCLQYENGVSTLTRPSWWGR